VLTNNNNKSQIIKAAEIYCSHPKIITRDEAHIK
jgi:hypothetical protein